jgi:hypothetical protein
MNSNSRTSNHQDLRFHKSKRLEVQAQADAKEFACCAAGSVCVLWSGVL